ncbi:hypothetical protein FQR65_LT00149 [Abscondita terminalis]|nr:hypothetical protein FQR65_LT00149 [Abscondita terminalis]
MTIGEHHISKRSLLFPQYTILQFTYGISAPLILPKRSINFSLCLQANYETPFNISHFFPTIVTGRSYDFDLDRHTFYQYIAEVLDGVGLHGETCLLRSICEVSEIPMYTEDNESHLLERIVHFLLSPAEDYYIDGNLNVTLNDVYVKAENWGKTYGKCHKRYYKCPVSIVNLFTKLFYIY